MSRRFIEDLAKKRQELLNALEVNGGDINLDIFEDFYPDQAHFVFELLQNAEDAGASNAFFHLSNDGCLFEHNGIRVFTEADVKGITGIHNSTKSKTPDQIGKFGVGFKSVFVYTLTPHVWSGDFSFKISRLILPEPIERDADIGGMTRFWLPFNNPDKVPNVAYAEVESGLKQLAETTLLFLSHLESIRWQNAIGESGEVKRFKHSEHHVEVLKHSDGKTIVSFHFLKFDQPVVGLDKQRVAVAFPIDLLPNVQIFESTKPLFNQVKIISATPGRVAVFFPAEKETSGLRFHLHAPFVPELSRASIKKTDANLPLFQQLATLVAASLHQIRDLGLLTVGFLAVLPNQPDKLSASYEPMRLAIVDEFRRHDLIPIRAGGHAKLENLIRCSSEVAKELSDDDISLIIGIPIKIAANPSQNNQREDQFLKSLSIRDWELGRSIAQLSKDQRPVVEAWMGKKDDESLGRWYALLNGARSHLNIGDLRIVRGRSATGMVMCLPSQSFFPNDAETTHPDDIFFVESAFCFGDSRAFLEHIGVQPYDEKATIQRILAKYVSPVEWGATHVDDVRMFMDFHRKNPTQASLFQAHRFLFGKIPGDGFSLCKPSNLYMDNRDSETLLDIYYNLLPDDKRTHHPLASEYCDAGIIAEDLAHFARAVGVQTNFNVEKLTSIADNPDKPSLCSGGKVGKIGDKYMRIEEDFVVREFLTLLKTPDKQRSKLIWRTMCEVVSKEHLRAKYRRNKISDFKYAPSQLVHQLRSTNWVPQDDGRFVKPSAANIGELPAGFSFDPGQEWLNAIGFGHDEKRRSDEYQTQDRMARQMGLASVDALTAYLDAIKESGLTPEQILAAGSQRKQITQPEEAVKDTARRRSRVCDDADFAPSKESVKREQSIQVGDDAVTSEARAYLRAKYMNDERQLVCQCCRDEMPFRLRSGDHYFVAVQCVLDLETRHYQNRLALCPTCAAMYQHARETDDIEIRRSLFENTADDKAPYVEIPLRLAGLDRRLRFVGTHWFDLKIVLSDK